MRRPSQNQVSPSAPVLQVGRVVSHLKELLDANGLSVRQLADRLGVADLRPLYGLRNNTARAYDFALLARVCALFDLLPLETLLEYVPKGAEPETHYQKRTVLLALPCPYGGIRSLILEHRGDLATMQYFEQVGDETALHWSTISNLANYRSKAVRSSTLAALCQHFGGIAHVYVYDPNFSWLQSGSESEHSGTDP